MNVAGWVGSRHFRQGGFDWVAMDEAHLGAALLHVALDPVRARLVERAQVWPWSSGGRAQAPPAEAGAETAKAEMRRGRWAIW